MYYLFYCLRFFHSFPPLSKNRPLKKKTALFSLTIYGQNFMSVHFDFHSFKIIGILFYGYSCILFAFEIWPCYITVTGLYWPWTSGVVQSQCPGWYDCMQVFTITSPVLINAKIVFPVLFSCVINSAISLCETILLIKFLKNVSIQREGAQTS